MTRGYFATETLLLFSFDAQLILTGFFVVVFVTYFGCAPFHRFLSLIAQTNALLLLTFCPVILSSIFFFFFFWLLGIAPVQKKGEKEGK